MEGIDRLVSYPPACARALLTVGNLQCGTADLACVWSAVKKGEKEVGWHNYPIKHTHSR